MIASEPVPRGRLWLVRVLLVVTVLTFAVPLGWEFVDTPVPSLLGVLFVFGVVLPLPCWAALLLLRDAGRPEAVRAGLVLARNAGALGALVLALLAWNAHFQAWVTDPVVHLVLDGALLGQLLLVGASWSALRRTAIPSVAVRSNVDRLASFAGHGVLAVLLLALLLIPVPDGHAKQRREMAALSTVRSMLSAQDAYASANGGLYGAPECLREPSKCLPGYPATGPVFLDVRFPTGQSEVNGYMYSFHAGPPPTAEQLRASGASASSLTAWAYVAVPVSPGRSGGRSFCSDASGVLWQTEATMPAPRAGRCPQGLDQVR